MVRWTSGSSGEQRRGIASIPAKGSQRLDQSGSEGWRGRRGSSWVLGFGRGGAAAENFGERLGGRLGGHEEKERERAGRKGLGSGFIGEHHSVEERERESRRAAGLRLTGGADVPLGHAWRPLGTGGSTWQGEGEPAEAARAVGGAARRHVERERAALGQMGLGRTAGEGSGDGAEKKQRSRGWRRKMRTDL
jgi:hypothetical protein